jgi:hypothetical protein
MGHFRREFIEAHCILNVKDFKKLFLFKEGGLELCSWEVTLLMYLKNISSNEKEAYPSVLCCEIIIAIFLK